LPTLAAYTKYPRQSYVKKPDTSRKSEEKFGVFFDGINNYCEIAKGLEIPEKSQGRGWYRHPLAFLAEAADDICYLVMDLEDGYRLGLVSYKETEDLLITICEQQRNTGYLDNLTKIRAEDQKIGYLRAKSINSLVLQVADLFEEKDQAIRDGVFDLALLDLVQSKKELDQIRKLSINKIYSHRPVVQIESAGFEVLGGLLGIFLEATVLKPKSKKSEKIRSLISAQFLDKEKKPFSDKYQTIMNITEYISCMTDTFAIDTYRILKGISLPNYSP